MAIYRYTNSPLIDRIELKHDVARSNAQATIIAAENTTAEQLEKLRVDLGARNISTLMDSVDGRAVIQVRGLSEPKNLFSALHELGLAKGKVAKELTPEDKKKVSYRERVRGKAMFLSSFFYHLGNAAFIVSGIQRGRHNPGGKFTKNDISELMIGATFSLGDVLMTFYGQDKGDEELNAAAWGLKRHLHQKGIEIPQGDALNPDTLHQSGAVKATDRWLRKHIGQVKCLTETAAGLFTIHSAMKPHEFGKINRSKLGGGFLITAAWLATFLLDKPRGNQIFNGNHKDSSTLIGNAAENPRGWIASPGAMFNNGLTLWGALNPKNGERTRFRDRATKAEQALSDARIEMDASNQVNLPWVHKDTVKDAEKNFRRAKAGQIDYIYNVFSACSFLIANMLFGLSGSKKRPHETDDDRTMMNDLVLLSANVLAKQPQQVRETSIGEMAEYVSKLAHVKMTKDQVAKAIHDKVDNLAHSTWASRVQAPSAPGPQLTV